MSVLDVAIWDDLEVIFTCTKLPERRKMQNTQNKKAFSHGFAMQWVIRSDRSDQCARKFLASPLTRDDVEQRPPFENSRMFFFESTICNTRKSTTNKQ